MPPKPPRPGQPEPSPEVVGAPAPEASSGGEVVGAGSWVEPTPPPPPGFGAFLVVGDGSNALTDAWAELAADMDGWHSQVAASLGEVELSRELAQAQALANKLRGPRFAPAWARLAAALDFEPPQKGKPCLPGVAEATGGASDFIPAFEAVPVPAPPRAEAGPSCPELVLWAARGPHAVHLHRARQMAAFLAGPPPGLQRPADEGPVVQAIAKGWTDPDALSEADRAELAHEAQADEAFAAENEALFALLRGWHPSEGTVKAEARLLRRAFHDGQAGGPRFRAEVARAEGVATLAGALQQALHRLAKLPIGEGFSLVWSLPHLGLRLILAEKDLAAALVGKIESQAIATTPAKWEPWALRLALIATLSAHGVLKGPCETCSFPAWVVPYRPPGKAGPKPLSDRLCPTCEVARGRALAAERMGKLNQRKRETGLS